MLKIFHKILNDMKLNGSPEPFSNAEKYEKASSDLTTFHKYGIPIVIIGMKLLFIILISNIFLYEEIAVHFKDTPIAFVVIFVSLIIYMDYRTLYIFTKLKIVYIGIDDIVIIDGFNDKIIKINYEDINEIYCSWLSRSDIVKIVLRTTENYYFLATYRYLKFFQDHPITDKIRVRIRYHKEKNNAPNKA